MHSTALAEIKLQLAQHQPKHILLASIEPPTELLDYLQSVDCHLTKVSENVSANEFFPQTNAQYNQKQSFAIVINYLEHLNKQIAIQQIALLRNSYCSKIWLGINKQAKQWQFQDFISLGFKRMQPVLFSNDDESNIAFINSTAIEEPKSQDQGDSLLNTYGYDLSHYNLKRNWNNPRYWANPEQWHKRW